MATTNEPIVVGVDGSEVAEEVAQWAAREADLRDRELLLIHAFTLPGAAGYPDFDSYPADPRATLQDECEAMLGRVAADLHDRYPKLRIRTEVVYERPVVALRAASAGALLTVVGSGNESRFNGVLLGSVALAVASSNPAPVAVVHRDHAQHTNGPVVVGVDSGGTSDAAVAFAFQSASVHGAELVALHAWHDVFVPGSHRLQSPLVDPDRIEQAERAVLAEGIAGWADKYPDVTVRQVLVEGRAVPNLLDYAQQAQLVVVGSHGHGGFAGMLLGSTSHSMIIHSAAPVVVVRTSPQT